MLGQMRTATSSILFKASISKEGNDAAYLGQSAGNRTRKKEN